MWRDEATTTLIDLWSEETIQFSLENCKTSKESSEVYRSLQVYRNIIRFNFKSGVWVF